MARGVGRPIVAFSGEAGSSPFGASGPLTAGGASLVRPVPHVPALSRRSAEQGGGGGIGRRPADGR